MPSDSPRRIRVEITSFASAKKIMLSITLDIDVLLTKEAVNQMPLQQGEEIRDKKAKEVNEQSEKK